MKVKEQLRLLDETVLFGDFEKAVQSFFSKDVKIIHKDKYLNGRKSKLQTIRHFMDMVASIDEIRLHRQYIQAPETYSLFTFRFSMHDQSSLFWHEIIRRKWDNGEVIEEEYWLNPGNQVIELLETNGSQKIEPAPKEIPVISKEAPDKDLPLTLIKGLGPKTAKALKEKGIEDIHALQKIESTKLQEKLDSLDWNSKYFDVAYLKTETEKILAGL
ncbi:MAG: hypothetical protein R2769_12525 [Saprospiraceae bacterium]